MCTVQLRPRSSNIIRHIKKNKVNINFDKYLRIVLQNPPRVSLEESTTFPNPEHRPEKKTEEKESRKESRNIYLKIYSKIENIDFVYM